MYTRFADELWPPGFWKVASIVFDKAKLGPSEALKLSFSLLEMQSS